jgi:hypothetical protein
MTDILVFVALIVAVIAGWAVCASLLPGPLSRRMAPVFALGTGFGLCSLLLFIFRRPMFTVESALLIGALAFLYRRRMGGLLPDSWQCGFLGLTFACILGFALITTMIHLDRMPHGNWDGWAIWNTHARLLYRNGPDWKNQLQYTYHGDYPELTPMLTARFWRYTGSEFPEAGGLVGIALGLSAIAVLVGVLAELRGTRLALVMGLILTGTPFFLDHMTSQYAEVPLSFFYLMAVSLLCLHTERAPTNKSMITLAGFAAGCAGWTKNEGLLFIVAILAAIALPVLLRRSRASARLFPFVAGLLLPLAVIVAFKFTVPVRNDLIENQSYQSALERITDPSRYIAIFKYLIWTAWTFGAWTVTPLVLLALFFAFRGIDRRITQSTGWCAGSLTLAIVLAGYFAVYVNTPLDLTYHLESSANRLVLHLWPSFLLLIGLCGKQDTGKTAAVVHSA